MSRDPEAPERKTLRDGRASVTPPAAKAAAHKQTAAVRGQAAEAMAADYLKSQGFQILKLNWRCRQGEIDIIAEEEGTLVFVEVKSRAAVSHGQPIEAVTRRKQARIVHAAALFAVANHRDEQPMRFDIVEIIQGRKAGPPTFRLCRAAFVPAGKYSVL